MKSRISRILVFLNFQIFGFLVFLGVYFLGWMFDSWQLAGFRLTPNAQVLRWVMQKACKSVVKLRTFAHFLVQNW